MTVKSKEEHLECIPLGVFRRFISYAWVTRWLPVFSPMERSPISGRKHGIYGHHRGGWP